MNAIAEPVERYRSLIERIVPELSGRGPDWLQTRRAQAAARFSERGFPNRKEEAWRYTSLDPLLSQSFQVADQPLTALDAGDIDEFLTGDATAARLVFANGRLVPHLCHNGGITQGVWIRSLRSALEEDPDSVAPWLGRAEARKVAAFPALNTALLDDGVCIRVPARVKLRAPIEILYVSIGLEEPTMASPRNLVVLGPGAEATVLERYVSPGDACYFNNGLTEVVLEEGARLTHHWVQEESREAFHFNAVHVQQAGKSRYRGLGVALGGAWSRREYHVRFDQEGAECTLDGLYLAGDGQLTDMHLDVEHAVPGCSSRERFKGILMGRGRAVFDGRIRVEPDAQRTDARLSNDNLLLSRQAEVDTKPQLEIFADDVQCSHGTTVGQLDPAQVFYLRSRGIAEADARRMLCLGFASEALQRCDLKGLRGRLEARLRDRLTASAVHHAADAVRE